MTLLKSIAGEFEAVVVGATGGIGEAIVSQLANEPRITGIHAWSRTAPATRGGRISWSQVDITREETIERAVRQNSSLKLVIVATGALHGQNALKPEKTWRDLDADRLRESFAINSIGPALVAKHVLPRFPRNQRAVFAALSARVGSIEDNRLGGWYGYRASKAALNQFIRTLSIELARSHPLAVCVGLHPGTVDTGLSKPFQSNVPDRQLFSPGRAASQLLQVIDGLTPQDTGHQFAWDGKRVPA